MIQKRLAYRLIRFGTGDRVLQPKDSQESVSWLKAELTRHDLARTIVVKHFVLPA